MFKNYKKLRYALIIVLVLLITSLCFVFLVSDNKNWIKTVDADLSVYKPYVFNTEINFGQKGNTKDYIKYEDGWGGQEEVYRVNMGKKSTIRLYIKDGKNSDILLNINCFGIFNTDKEKFQTITLVANGTEVQKWEMNFSTNTYSARIPANLMQNNELVLEFITDKPYASPTDSRLRGMAVKKMVLKNNSASKTKKKVAKWLKNKLSKLK